MQQRQSKKRDQILNVLIQEHGALSASEIHTRLPEINLTTIYRNLESFLAQGVVQRLQLDSKEAKYEYSHEPHHHAVCAECHKVIHFTAPDEQIKKLLNIKGFAVDEVEVTVRGVCNHNK